MGACSFTMVVVADDIRKKIMKLKESNCSHGSEGIDSIDFKSRYSKTFNCRRDLQDFIDKRLDILRKREGEIIDLGVDHYVKATVDYRKVSINDLSARIEDFERKLPFLQSKLTDSSKHILIDEHGSLMGSYSNMINMKECVRSRMFYEQFDTDYYILTTKSIILCTGVGDVCYEKPKNSTEYKYIPFNKYYLIGWASE